MNRVKRRELGGDPVPSLWVYANSMEVGQHSTVKGQGRPWHCCPESSGCLITESTQGWVGWAAWAGGGKLCPQQGVRLNGLYGPFQPKPCYGSMIPIIHMHNSVTASSCIQYNYVLFCFFFLPDSSLQSWAIQWIVFPVSAGVSRADTLSPLQTTLKVGTQCTEHSALWYIQI